MFGNFCPSRDGSSRWLPLQEGHPPYRAHVEFIAHHASSCLQIAGAELHSAWLVTLEASDAAPTVAVRDRA
jgi:hypothetical protein